jgi:photosystem II stability/assembly factor-like uncharacterized protein
MRISLRFLLACLCAVTVFSQTCVAADQADTQKPMPTYGQWHSSRFGGGGYLQHVVVCASNPKRAYVNVDVGGLYRSDDGGHSWQMLHGNLPAHRANYGVRGVWVDPADQDYVVIATGGRWDGKQGIFISTDAGQTWKRTHSAWYWGNGPKRAAGSILVSDPKDSNRLYTAPIDNGFAISTDKGKTWQANGQLKGVCPTAVWVDPVNTNNVWVACTERKVNFEGKDRDFQAGFYHSPDFGKTFSKVSDNSISEMVQLPWGKRPLVAILKSDHIIQSNDMGKTWQPLEDGLPIDEEAARKRSSISGSAFNAWGVGPDFVLLGARNGDIYRLDNNQTKWSHIKPLTIREGNWWGRIKPGQWQHYGKALGAITVSPVDPNHWFMTDWYAIYQSHDAGKSWDLSIDGVEVTVIHTITPDPFKPEVVHAGMADNGYIHSENRAVSFYKVGGGPSNVKHVAASYAKEGLIYYVGPKGHEWLANQLYKSTNHGMKFSACKMKGLPDMTDRRCNSVALDPKDPDRLWLAVSGKIAPGEGGVYRSDDGGQSFTWDSDAMTGTSFFATSIWDTGPQLAINENGSMIAIGSSTRGIYIRQAGAGQWEKFKLDLDDWAKPSCVAASMQAPGIMAVAVRGKGLYLSSDNGAHFQHVWEGDCSYVALDNQLPNRIAISTGDGIALSTDYGQTFSMLDRGLPDRVIRLPLAFSGNRIVVGTAGSGLFYIDLPRNQQAKVDSPWLDQLNQQVRYLKTDNMQIGVLLNGGNLVDLRLTGQPNMMDTYSNLWDKTGKNMPSTSAKDRVEYRGHTTWLSPQTSWWQYQSVDPERKAKKDTWPPDPYLTQLPYQVVEQSGNRLVIQSPKSNITGMQLTKTFEILDAQVLKLTTKATNISEQEMVWGLWSNTRVKAAGTASIPVKPDSQLIIQHVNPWKNPDPQYRFVVTNENGWLSLTNQTTVPFDAKRDTKLRVDPAERLIIYRLGDEVLVKQTEPVDVSKLADGHRSIEAYRSESQAVPTEDLLEIQFLYPTKTVKPGESVEASEQWTLCHASEFGNIANRSKWLDQVRRKVAHAH